MFASRITVVFLFLLALPFSSRAASPYPDILPIPGAAPGQVLESIIHDEQVIVGSAKYANDDAVVFVFEDAGSGWGIVEILQNPNPEDGDLFGKELAADCGVLLVAAPMKDVNGIRDAGMVYVYQRSAVLDKWQLVHKLTAANPREGYRFGTDIDINGDGIIIGEQRPANPDEGHFTPDGAVYIFEHDYQGAQWQQAARFEVPEDYWPVIGNSVAISGTTALAGTGSAGAVVVYERAASGWYEQGAFELDQGGASFPPAIRELTLDGDLAIIGTPHHRDESYLANGRVYVMQRSGGNWNEMARLASPDSSDAQFAWRVAYHDGLIAAMAAFGDEAHLFGETPSSGWQNVASIGHPSLMPNNTRLHDISGKYMTVRGKEAILVYDLDPLLAEYTCRIAKEYDEYSGRERFDKGDRDKAAGRKSAGEGETAATKLTGVRVSTKSFR